MRARCVRASSYSAASGSPRVHRPRATVAPTSVTTGRARAQVNARLISLADAPNGYKDFDRGASVKYVIDPHGTCRSHLKMEHHKF